MTVAVVLSCPDGESGSDPGFTGEITLLGAGQWWAKLYGNYYGTCGSLIECLGSCVQVMGEREGRERERCEGERRGREGGREREEEERREGGRERRRERERERDSQVHSVF